MGGYFTVPLVGLTKPGIAKELTSEFFTRYSGPGRPQPEIMETCALTLWCSWGPRAAFLEKTSGEMALRTSELCATLDDLYSATTDTCGNAEGGPHEKDKVPSAPPAQIPEISLPGGEGTPAARRYLACVGRGPRSLPGPPSHNRCQGRLLGGSSRATVPPKVTAPQGMHRSSSLRSKRPVAHNGPKGSTLGDAEMLDALRRAFRTPMEAFRAFDTNLDGTIDRAEFEIGLKAVSAPRVPCAGTVARLFNQADADELGFISMGRMCDLFGVY